MLLLPKFTIVLRFLSDASKHRDREIAPTADPLKPNAIREKEETVVLFSEMSTDYRFFLAPTGHFLGKLLLIGKRQDSIHSWRCVGAMPYFSNSHNHGTLREMRKSYCY